MSTSWIDGGPGSILAAMHIRALQFELRESAPSTVI